MAITPGTDPDRFTDQEKALFDQGKCSAVTEYGNGGRTKHCGQPSQPGTDFGACAEHADDQ